MHERNFRQSGKLFPSAALRVGAAIELDVRAGVISTMQRQARSGSDLLCLLCRKVYGLDRAEKRDKTFPYVRFIIAVNEEVTAQTIFFCIVMWLVAMLELGGQQQHWWRFSFDDERLGGAEAAYIDSLIRKPPALSVWMKIVPVRSEVEIKNIPADSLSCVRDDRRRVAGKRSAVETEGR